MDGLPIEERARRAASLVASSPLDHTIARAFAIGLLAFFYGAVSVLLRAPAEPTPGLVALLVGLIVLGITLVVCLVTALDRLRTHRLAIDWILAGDFDRASAHQLALLEKRRLVPEWRTTFALSLASTTLMAGHADRALVLLRAVEGTGPLRPFLARSHRDATALALLALGEVEAARRMAAKKIELRGVVARLVAKETKVELVVEALAGSLERAEAAAAATIESLENPRRRRGYGAYADAQRAYGWLLVAYVWERVAAAKPEGERGEPARKRAEALARASRTPRAFYGYLRNVSPAFVEFAERATAKAT